MNSTHNRKQVALVTGASSGIGRELARLHARNGGDLVLVARSQARLDELASELKLQHQTRSLVLAMDLDDPSAPQKIYDAVKSAGIEVDYLINNAGVGGRGAFHERKMEDDLSMIQLNVVALTALTRLFLPEFVARKSGRVLNVSSTAGLMPGPLQAVYYATKAFVTSFSNAIAIELEGTGVTVTALQPGTTETGFAKAADLDKTPLFSAQKPASAEMVAKQGYDAMLSGKLDVVAGLSVSQRLMMAAVPFTPKKMLLRQIRTMQSVR